MAIRLMKSLIVEVLNAILLRLVEVLLSVEHATVVLLVAVTLKVEASVIMIVVISPAGLLINDMMASGEFTSVVVSISEVLHFDVVAELVSLLDISFVLILNLLLMMVFFLESAS